MKKLRALIISLALAVGLVGAAAVPAGAVNFVQNCDTGTICEEAKKPNQVGSLAKDVVNILLYVLGIICVIVIIVGGIRYATSDGDSSKIKGAKDSIVYAVVGLIIAILAFGIVNFVVGAFGGSGGSGGGGGGTGTGTGTGGGSST